MAAADFHEPFWVAIAAAAPVIGLASAVNADQTVRRSEREIRRATKAGEDLPPIPNPAYWMSYTNIGLQAVALSLALYCLGTAHDHLDWGRQIAGVMAVLGMGLVLAPAWWTTTRIYRPYWAARKARWKAKWEAIRRGSGGDHSGP